MAGKGKIENLRPPWKPGESGNPSGRPKKRPLSDTSGEFAGRRLPEELRLQRGLWDGATFADAVTQALFMSATNGDVSAARELREGIEGKASERPREIPGPVEIRVISETPIENPAALEKFENNGGAE
jgi:hypothetical protein